MTVQELRDGVSFHRVFDTCFTGPVLILSTFDNFR